MNKELIRVMRKICKTEEDFILLGNTIVKALYHDLENLVTLLQGDINKKLENMLLDIKEELNKDESLKKLWSEK